MNRKDCTEYCSCMEAAKVVKACGTVTPMTRDWDNNEIVIDLHCEACNHYKTVGNV